MQHVTTLDRCYVDARRHQATVELIVVLTGLVLVLWTDSRYIFPKHIRTINTVLVGMVIGGILWRQRPSIREMGFAPPKGWFDGAATLALITAVPIAIATTIGWCLGSLGQVHHLDSWAAKNWPHEGIQQILLQVVLVPRLRTIVDRDDWTISALAAATFSLLHAPNAGLMILTALAGFFWCQWFRKHPNLPALWVSHFLMAVSALWTLNPYLAHLRVGIGCLWSSVPRVS